MAIGPTVSPVVIHVQTHTHSHCQATQFPIGIGCSVGILCIAVLVIAVVATVATIVIAIVAMVAMVAIVAIVIGLMVVGILVWCRGKLHPFYQNFLFLEFSGVSKFVVPDWHIRIMSRI